MLSTNKQIAIFTFAIVLLCFISVFIFTLPSFTTQLNLTTKSNIGSAVGGITAPIIGVISSVLLYLALTRQTQSNIDQRLKNDSDIIFLLINQLDNEVASFYYKYSKGSEERKYTGLEGLNEYCRKYRYEHNLKQFEDKEDFSFKKWYESGQIVLIVEGYNLIEQRIKVSNLSKEMKKLFSTKLETYYECKLSSPLIDLSEAFDLHPHQKDDYTAIIQDLVSRQRSTTNKMLLQK